MRFFNVEKSISYPEKSDVFNQYRKIFRYLKIKIVVEIVVDIVVNIVVDIAVNIAVDIVVNIVVNSSRSGC